VTADQPGLALPAPAIAELRGVSKRFGERVAVDGLDLGVSRGECFGLLGPNGAGKTTTLRMLYGVTRPSAGVVRAFGIDVARDPRAVRARLGVTLQQNVLLEALSPEDNLRVFGRYHLLGEGQLRLRVAQLIEQFDLASHARVPVRALSGGYQRRLAIALSLVARPELLILDEPTTGLDPQVRLALWERVRELRAAGTTVLVTTHYMDEAERLCDRLAILARGRLRAEGAPAALIREHVAAEALELTATPEEEAALVDLAGGAPPRRRLRIGSRLMVYADDVRPFVERVRARDGGDRRPLVVRPTNLEDVFLALTGASLESPPEDEAAA
jgi:lipooligosaccharide transport system ATP-binding protein